MHTFSSSYSLIVVATKPLKAPINRFHHQNKREKKCIKEEGQVIVQILFAVLAAGSLSKQRTFIWYETV